jgi:hypothetical protein
MYEARQTSMTRVADLVQQGKMTLDEGNVEYVRIDKVRLVMRSLPASVRKALNEGVKAGKLGHLKKDGLKPEAYFHPLHKGTAIFMRENRQRAVWAATGKIIVPRVSE